MTFPFSDFPPSQEGNPNISLTFYILFLPKYSYFNFKNILLSTYIFVNDKKLYILFKLIIKLFLLLN